MEWTNETVLEFLNLYEDEPVIWNPSHALHKNRNEIYDAWTRIKNNFSMPCSVTDLKKKKESLMSSFRTCLNKVKQSRKSGAEADKIHVPTWFAFETMARFLRNKDQPEKTIKSEDINSHESSGNEGIAGHLEEDEININETDENVGTKLCKSTSLRTFKIPPNKKMRMSSEQDPIIHTPIQEAFSVFKNKTKKDDCALYCQLLAGKLRKMDELTRDIVMNQIDNLVFRARRGNSQCQYIAPMHFNSHSPTHLIPSCSSPVSFSSSSELSNVSHCSHSQPDLAFSKNVSDSEDSQLSTEDA